MGDPTAQPTSGPSGRRRYARFPVSLLILVRAKQFPGRGIPGTVRNIGAGGLMAEFPVQMVPGSAMRLLLQTRGGPLTEEGQVVWTAVTPGAVRHGVAFPEPKGQDFAVDLFVTDHS